MTGTYTEIFFAVCILILPFLYESSHVFRYHLKFFLYYGITMVNSVILIPVFCFRPKDVKNLLLASTFCRICSTLIGIRWILKGQENLEKDQSCVIVANHQSSLDILGMFELWPHMNKCTVIAKRELFYMWPFGLAAWLCGLIFIPRVQKDKAKSVMNEAAEGIKQTNTKLWIFPEGTRRNTGEIHPFKKGAFHLAITSQLPIVPVVYSQYYFLNKPAKRFDHGKVIINALPQIETKGLTVNDIDKLMDQVRDVMTTTFHENNKFLKESLKNPAICRS
ncbi:1-acyl-sn-glycerol-3-phosphate acyltransferase alpha [Aethina tumida]|uniref:1-acyl-sn-glycerol-3-phosphate acyltransferase alpha n=1 Tax=Aethina tumida TaxID=116153 RepID=UPI00096AFB93|nr:1-acyl-sn-glycerol-3-phosphate acyltransferase alpha [Aethina tumida]